MKKEKILKWGYIDRKGEMVIAPQYDGAWDFSEGLAAVRVEWARGYIDKSGRYVIEPKFQSAGPFIDGMALVMDDDKYGFINQEGNYIIEPRYDKAREFHDGLAMVQVGELFGYVDRTGAYVVSPQYLAATDFDQGVARVMTAEGWIYIDREGREVPATEDKTEEPESDAALRPTVVDGKLGYADRDGNLVIAAKYYEAMPFVDGLARVKTGRTSPWTYITPDGKPAFNLRFEGAEDFHEGLARVLVEVK